MNPSRQHQSSGRRNTMPMPEGRARNAAGTSVVEHDSPRSPYCLLEKQTENSDWGSIGWLREASRAQVRRYTSQIDFGCYPRTAPVRYSTDRSAGASNGARLRKYSEQVDSQ